MSAQPKRRRLETELIGDVLVVNFTDKRILDDENIRIIKEQLLALAEETTATKVIVSFGNVEYHSTAALGGLLTFHKKLGSKGAKLVLCSIDHYIYETFEITRLNKFFNIQKDEQAALQQF